MKNTLFLFATLITSVFAQNLTSLPECEQSCVSGVVASASSLGCSATDAACLCSKAEFAYAIRDCSSESCPSGTDIDQVNAYGVTYCQSAQSSASGTTLAALGIFSTGATSGTASTTTTSSGSSTESAVTTIPVVSTTVSSGSTIETTLGSTTILETISGSNSSTTSANVTSTAVTTEPIVSTETTDGTTRETTIGSTTVSSAETISTSASSSSSSAAAAAGATVPFAMPGLFRSVRSPPAAVAEALGLGILGIAGMFLGAGFV